MPSVTVGNSAVQSAVPDLGNGSHFETMKQILGVMDKKVRNMEKKKVSELKLHSQIIFYCIGGEIYGFYFCGCVLVCIIRCFSFVSY